jgi:hypothetical protein
MAREGLLSANQTRRRENAVRDLMVIQWLHVLLGMCWFDSTRSLDFVVILAVMTLPLEQQRTVSKPSIIFSNRMLIPAALLVIILGLVHGTIFGLVQSWSFLIETAYGITFLIASLAAVATFLWGRFTVDRAARHLETFPLTDVMKSGGTVALAYAAQTKRVKLLALLQLLGFFIIFICMILIHLGV